MADIVTTPERNGTTQRTVPLSAAQVQKLERDQSASATPSRSPEHTAHVVHADDLLDTSGSSEDHHTGREQQ